MKKSFQQNTDGRVDVVGESHDCVEHVAEAAETGSKRTITELVMIVDRSGSMHGLEADTIGGINAVMEKNSALDADVTVSVVLFDDVSEVLYDRVPLKQVRPLTERDYQVRGCTALLDAVGGSIRHAERVQKYMPKEYKADKVIFVITTDGLENASRRYTYSRVKRAIECKQEEGWEFLFLGANIDAAAEAGRIGISCDRAATYVPDGYGNEVMYGAVADATVKMQLHPTGRIDGDWAAPVHADHKKRGGFFHRH